MINIKLLAIVTPPSIYHGCFTLKTFWEKKFTGEENFTLGEFSATNMKNYGHQNVRKHRDIKGSNKMSKLTYLSLPLISLCFLTF